VEVSFLSGRNLDDGVSSCYLLRTNEAFLRRAQE
jgi:hypothetical protein